MAEVIAQSVEVTVTPRAFPVTVAPQTYPVTVAKQEIRVIEVIQQGPMGPAGHATTLIINITEASLVWTLSHQLNRYPDPTFVDSSGDVVVPTWRYQDSNIIIANFGNPTSGVAYIN